MDTGPTNHLLANNHEVAKIYQGQDVQALYSQKHLLSSASPTLLSYPSLHTRVGW